MSAEYPIVTKKHNYKRIIIISIAVLIGIPLMFFILVTSSQLFARAEDMMPHDVTATEITKSSAVITWITDNNTQGVVEYGIDPDALNSYAPEESPRKEHAVDLTLLSSSTTYYFHIKIDDKTYDNGGMPWSFTTKTSTGEDVAEQVKGISTRITKVSAEDLTPTAKPGCTAKTCSEIQKMFGKGCTVSDYVKCLSSNSSTTTGTPTPTAGSSTTTSASPTPSLYPTSVQIKSSYCSLAFIQSDPSSSGKCSRWVWDSLNTKTSICSQAFDRYVLECKNRSFETGGSDELWYFKGAIEDIASTSATLNMVPSSGTTIYCRVRAEDRIGGSDDHATAWVNASKKCE